MKFTFDFYIFPSRRVHDFIDCLKKLVLNICKFVHFPYSFVGFPIAERIGKPAASQFTSSRAIRIVTGFAPHTLSLVTDNRYFTLSKRLSLSHSLHNFNVQPPMAPGKTLFLVSTI
jgi:hypothetical protein